MIFLVTSTVFGLGLQAYFTFIINRDENETLEGLDLDTEGLASLANTRAKQFVIGLTIVLLAPCVWWVAKSLILVIKDGLIWPQAGALALGIGLTSLAIAGLKGMYKSYYELEYEILLRKKEIYFLTKNWGD